MSNEFLHLVAREVFRRGILQAQERADSLQATTRWSMFGCSPRKTTSFLCFQISQQQSRMVGWAMSGWTLGGVWVSQSSAIGAILSGFHPIRLQKLLTKLHSEKMWSAVSSACPQISQVASWRMVLVTRAVLQLILFFVSSQAKNLTLGGAKLRQRNLKEGHGCSFLVDTR
jgi:hypothetical protein